MWFKKQTHARAFRTKTKRKQTMKIISARSPPLLLKPSRSFFCTHALPPPAYTNLKAQTFFLQKQKIKRTIWALNVQNICYNKNKFDILYMYNFAQKNLNSLR